MTVKLKVQDVDVKPVGCCLYDFDSVMSIVMLCGTVETDFQLHVFDRRKIVF